MRQNRFGQLPQPHPTVWLPPPPRIKGLRNPCCASPTFGDQFMATARSGGSCEVLALDFAPVPLRPTTTGGKPHWGAVETYTAPVREGVQWRLQNFSSNPVSPPSCCLTAAVNTRASVHGMEYLNQFAKTSWLCCASRTLGLDPQSPDSLSLASAPPLFACALFGSSVRGRG